LPDEKLHKYLNEFNLLCNSSSPLPTSPATIFFGSDPRTMTTNSGLKLGWENVLFQGSAYNTLAFTKPAGSRVFTWVLGKGKKKSMLKIAVVYGIIGHSYI